MAICKSRRGLRKSQPCPNLCLRLVAPKTGAERSCCLSHPLCSTVFWQLRKTTADPHGRRWALTSGQTTAKHTRGCFALGLWVENAPETTPRMQTIAACSWIFSWNILLNSRSCFLVKHPTVALWLSGKGFTCQCRSYRVDPPWSRRIPPAAGRLRRYTVDWDGTPTETVHRRLRRYTDWDGTPTTETVHRLRRYTDDWDGTPTETVHQLRRYTDDWDGTPTETVHRKSGAGALEATCSNYRTQGLPLLKPTSPRDRALQQEKSQREACAPQLQSSPHLTATAEKPTKQQKITGN